MLVSFIMGFACGLPLLLTKGVLQAWMKKEGIDLSLIGLTNLLAIPYSIKFLWAPFLDRYTRSEEHTSELQSHSFISYAVFCLKKKIN